VDESGKPIPNAGILAVGGDFDSGRFDWSSRTDEKGIFEWVSVPPSHKLYSVHADGFASLTRLELAADGEEHLIVLRKSTRSPRLRVSGTAVDTETRQPIEAFEVWVTKTRPYRGAPLTTAPELRTTGKDGRFSFLASKSYNFQEESYTVEVRADGYLAATLPVPAYLTNGFHVNFALNPTPRLTGVVQTPDGQPASGAVVLLCAKPDDTVRLILPGQFGLADFRGNHAETDTNGAFAVGTATPNGTVLIAHNSGYVEIPIAQMGASHTLRLESWGGVAGLLMIGSQPGSNETIVLSKMPPLLSARLSTMTEAGGHFAIGRLPPGEWRISHELKQRGRPIRPPLTQTTPIQVMPGKITQVRLGGAGRKVVGRVRMDEQAQRLDWKFCLVSLTAELPDLPVPSRDQFASDEGYFTAKSEWTAHKSGVNSSLAERESWRNLRQNQSVLEPDGSFTVDDVVPGAYKLRIESKSAGVVELRNLLPSGSRDVMTWDLVVPEQSGTDATPFDCGLLEPNSKNP